MQTSRLAPEQIKMETRIGNNIVNSENRTQAPNGQICSFSTVPCYLLPEVPTSGSAPSPEGSS